MLAERQERIEEIDDMAHLVPFLNALRMRSLECRASARLDLFQASRAERLKCEKTFDQVARDLVRVLGQALGKHVKFLRPGSESRSFDEHWLLRTLESQRLGDMDSYQFLLVSRVSPAKRSSLDRLLKMVAKHKEIFD